MVCIKAEAAEAIEGWIGMDRVVRAESAVSTCRSWLAVCTGLASFSRQIQVIVRYEGRGKDTYGARSACAPP